MNNPIGRMPNPMAVPPISPMGVTPTAQNMSAMAMPVVTQPKVDMQMMGTSPEKRKKFNDLMESLSAPRQESEDLPNVQGLHYGGMAGGFGMPMMPMMQPMMSPYMGMGGFGGMGGLGMFGSPFAYNATQPLNSGNPFGNSMNNTSTMNPSLDVFTTDMKPSVGMREDQQLRPTVIDPNSPEEIEKRKVGLQNLLSNLGTFPIFQGYERGGNVNIPMGRRNLLPQDTPGTKREMMKRDYASQAFRNAMDMRKLDRMMSGFNPRTAEASTSMPDVAANSGILAAAMQMLDNLKDKSILNPQAMRDLERRFEESELSDMISSARKKGGNMLETIKKGLPRFPINRAYGGQVGIGSFANGGPVQQFSNGGDTTIPDFFSNIGNMIKNLISPVNKAKSVDTGFGDLSDPKSAFPGSDLNFSEPPKILTLEGNINKNVPPSPRRGGAGDNPNPLISGPSKDFVADLVPAPQYLQSQKSPQANVSSEIMGPEDFAPYPSPRRGGAGLNPNTLYDFDAFDIGTGTPKVTDPFNVGGMGEFDTSLAGLDSFERARRERPVGVAGGRGEDPRNFMQNNAGRGSDPRDFMTETFPATETPARRDVFKDLETLQKAQAEATAKDQQGQQGFGIGQFLPLILGMFNPTAGMALGIMQAMSGQGEGEGLLGGILPNLAKTLGIGDTERTFGDYTFRSLEDPKSGESAGMTPEKRRELFLKNQASNAQQNIPASVQDNIDAITKPTVPDPVLGEDGTYSCPLPYVYDPNTKVCVMMEAGLGGQGVAANETKAPAGMQMGGSVDPNLNMAVDNFIQALA